MTYKIKIFLIVSSMLGIGLQFLVADTPVLATATLSEAVACFNTYNGQNDSRGQNIEFTANTLPAYKNSSCDKKGAGGPCTLTNAKGTKSIACTKPNAAAILQYCTDTYDGQSFGDGTDGTFSSQAANDYKKTCDSSNKGPCRLDQATSQISCGATGEGGSKTCTSAGLAGAKDGSCIVTGTGDPALTKNCVKAQDSASNGACGLVEKYVNPAIQLLSAIAGIAVAIAIAYGGIMYASSGGDQGKVTKAKELIRNAVLAMIGFAFLWSFLQWLVPGGVFHS